MKAEDWIYRLIKSVSIKHIMIFFYINLIVFSSTYYFFKKQPVKIDYLSTVNLVIPLYTGIGVGSYLKVLNAGKLTNEFNKIPYEEKYNKCRLSIENYNEHVLYYSNEKFTVSFDNYTPYVIQVQHPDKQIVDECIDVFLNISSNMFDQEKQKILKLLNKKLKFEKKKKQKKDEALNIYINKLKNALQDTSEEGKRFLTQIYFDYFKNSYLSENQYNLEVELYNNKNLAIGYEVINTKIELEPFNIEKTILVNLIASLGLVFMFLIYFASRKNKKK